MPAPTPAPAIAWPPAEPRAFDPRYDDGHCDRVLLLPTAETHPAGTYYLTSYEIVIGQVGYALSDRTQLSLTGTPPLTDEGVVPLDLSVKTVLLREEEVRVAAIGSLTGVLNLGEFSGFLGRVGGVAQLCLTQHCRSSVSVSSNWLLAGPASVVVSGAGAILRTSRLVAFLLEIDTLVPLGEPVGEANGAAGLAGLRLSGAAWGVDLGLARSVRTRDRQVLPVVVGTYRGLP